MGKNGTAAVTNVPPKFVPELDDYPRVMITDLIEYQGELKDLTKREYNKILNSFSEHGFFLQFFAWEAPDGVIYILDGHQRKRVFIGEGWLVPVPVQFIKAKSYEDAKKKLLVITSQYGRVTQDGFDAFTFDLDDEWIKETVQFDALPFVFDFENEQEPPEFKEYGEDTADGIYVCTCSECGHKHAAKKD